MQHDPPSDGEHPAPEPPPEDRFGDAVGMDLASGVAAFEAKEFRRALQLLSPLAGRGHPEASYRVAILYQNGLGLVRSPDLALAAMGRAAEQGHALAMHGLGNMYRQGDCASADPSRALHWLHRAAEQGLAGAKLALAQMYAAGEGVAPDPERARMLYEEAGFDPRDFETGDDPA